MWKVCEKAYNLITIGKEKSTDYYNKTSLNKNAEFKEGDKVWVQDLKSKLWSEGNVIKVLPLRSYLVKIDKNNRIVRRNDIFIKNLIHFKD